MKVHDMEGIILWIFLAAGVLVVSGVGTYFMVQGGESFDIISDFKAIKTAMRNYRNENIGLTKGIENLAPYLPSDSKVNLDHYLLSIDDKFLVVKKLPRGANPAEIVKKIGGQSKYTDGKLKLSFFTLSNSPDPVAVIKIKPMANISTKTKIEYSHEDSIVDSGEILKFEWENNEDFFDEEGVQTVKLRVMDKHFRWSEWESLDIFVTEEKGVKALQGSSEHLFVIHNNGNVEAYGENAFGQLGNCTNQPNAKLEFLVQMKQVEDIATGDYHTLFLKSDARVFASGKNDFGQLGIGNRNNSKIPKLTWGIENIVYVSAGYGFSAAVSSEGHVYTWGQNEVQCLGYNHSHFMDRPSRVENLVNIKSISLGKNFALALSYDGTVTSWGVNDNAELALGFKSKHNEPSVTTLKGIAQVIAGAGFGFAVTQNGKVMSFGLNKSNQLGFEGEQFVMFPKEIAGLKNIKKVVTEGDHSLALDETGNIYEWGPYGPLDDKYSVKPYLCEELKYVKDIAVTANHGYALLEDGSVYRFSSKFSTMLKLERAAKKEVYED